MKLFKRNKNNNRPLLRQIIDLIPVHILGGAISLHKSDKYCSAYFTRDQLVSQMFGQLNKCYTLEDISAGQQDRQTYFPAKSPSETDNQLLNPLKTTLPSKVRMEVT